MLPELGAGLAHSVVVLADVAVQQPAFILVDEPEFNLHPSLQLDFLTTLGSYARHGVLFTTHSVGLARASADRIYSVRMENGASRVQPYEQTPRLAEFIGELSFSGYQELGFDQILMVEGPTEVKTIQQFLRLYAKDHKVVLLPLGGAGLIRAGVAAELSEVKRITDNVAVLIDSERAADGTPLGADREAFVQDCATIGIDRHVMSRRAMENYLTTRAIQQVKGDKYSQLGPYDALKDAPMRWAKSENWRIARAMIRAELDGTDLGRFLTAL